jgi:hypothetical protein
LERNRVDLDEYLRRAGNWGRSLGESEGIESLKPEDMKIIVDPNI